MTLASLLSPFMPAAAPATPTPPAPPPRRINRARNPEFLGNEWTERIPEPREYRGSWRKKPQDPEGVIPFAGDGEVYGLCVMRTDEVQYGNTHKLRCPPKFIDEMNDQGVIERVMVHPGYSWAGSEAEFKKRFEPA